MSKFFSKIQAITFILIGILALMILAFLLSSCSHNKQRTRTYVDDQLVQEMVVEKISFCYWTKFRAMTLTEPNMMVVYVYDAEGKPDAETAKAITEGIISGAVGVMK